MKKIWFLITLIMLLFTIYAITTSYAKYVADATAETQRMAGAWIIKINDLDITSANAIETFAVDKVNFPENEFVVEDKAAPSSEGYFDIVIDPTGTSVAIRFDIEIENLEIINFERLCRVIDDEEITTGIVKTDDNVFSGIITLDDVKQGVPNILRIYLKWRDNETTQSDENDSLIGTYKGGTEEIPVKVTVSQYLGETIIPCASI